MRIKNENLTLSSTDMSANITSNAIWLGHIANFAIQLTFTGSPTGTFKLQASNDEGANDLKLADASITNWTDVDGSDQAITEAGNHMWNVQNCGYRWVRVVYTFTSGTGSITVARMNVKGV
jgi:hypothetical protein